MTRRTLGLFALTALGIIATQGAAMAETPPEPDPTEPEPVDPEPTKEPEQPQRRPFEDPH